MAWLRAGLWNTVKVVTKMTPYTIRLCLALPHYSWGPRKDSPMYDRYLHVLNFITSLGPLYLQLLEVIPTSVPLCWRTSLRCLLLPKDGSLRRSTLGKKTKDDGMPTPRGPAPSMLMGPFTSPKIISLSSPDGVLAHSLLRRGSLGSG